MRAQVDDRQTERFKPGFKLFFRGKSAVIGTDRNRSCLDRFAAIHFNDQFQRPLFDDVLGKWRELCVLGDADASTVVKPAKIEFREQALGRFVAFPRPFASFPERVHDNVLRPMAAPQKAVLPAAKPLSGQFEPVRGCVRGRPCFLSDRSVFHSSLENQMLLK